MNPLLKESSAPFEAFDFSELKVEHFIPALEAAIKEAKENLEKLKLETDITFDNIILKEETSADRLDLVCEIFYALHSAHCTDELSAIAPEFNEKLTSYASDVSLDSELFAKIKETYDKRDRLNLSTEQKTVLENSYQGYVRNGALLNEKDKEKLRTIDQNLSQLSLKFSENLRKATNAYVLFIDNKDDLAGLPEGIIEAALEEGKRRDREGEYAFTLEYPSYLPFMQYADNRELRKTLWMASAAKATEGEFDNKPVILEIVKFRKERAELLGFMDHPSFVLERRMAKKPEAVTSFIEEMISKAKGQAQTDANELKAFKKKVSGDESFEPYDTFYYREKLKKEKLDFDDEVLRPYFKLENVLDGIFQVAKKLYGISFKERQDIPKYHEEVKTFEVLDEKEQFVGLFYGDYFPRAEKRSGAWMTTLRQSGFQFGEVKRPFVCNVCNFTKPSKTKPSLLTLNEVLTLFHEFGHGLHGLLSKTQYKSVSGPNVFWDFVELPSQIMENWVLEKECLDLFAKHYETGETIPIDLIEKIKKAQQFQEGLATMRQMSFAKLDMQWHLADPKNVNDVFSFEEKIMKDFEFFGSSDKGHMSCSFGHIFAGGYSSGYYSYKWAEVLDADAFSYFQENGIFDTTIAKSFKENILEKGGSEDPMVLYKNFRGQEPTPDALLKRGGLI